MRKNLVKQILYLWLIGIIFGCSTPEFLLEEQTNKNIKVSVLRKPEIEAKKFLFTKISKMNQNLLTSNIQNKTVTSSIYNFSIDTNICKMVEINGITTYTFGVTREQSNNLFENLILKENSDGSYLARLYQYNVTETEKNQILNGIDVDMTDKITVIEINDTDFVSNVFGKIYYSGCLCYQADIVTVPGKPCVDGLMWGDTSCQHYGTTDAPTQTTMQVVYIPVDCGGGGGGPDDDGGFDGGGTSPTDDNSGELQNVFTNSENKTPCPGDPIQNPKICPSSPTNIAGGTYGCTRSGEKCDAIQGKKKHGGIDIKCEPLEKVYAMYSGTVVDKRNTFQHDQYAKKSFGNYVTIESIINGQTIRIKYCHLGYVADLATGLLSQGHPFALSGTSGNAARKSVTPHIHIEALKKVGNIWVKINPIDLLDTEYSNNFQPIGSKSDCLN